MASKEYEYMDEEDVMNEVKIYNKARKQGFPVPHTTRFFLTKHYEPALLMTDMTYGGKYKIWGFNDNPTKKEIKDLKEMQLTPDDLTRIKSLSEQIKENAIRRNRHIGFQNYHIRKNIKTGEVDVVLLDLDDRFTEQTYNISQTNNKELRNFLDIATGLSTGIITD